MSSEQFQPLPQIADYLKTAEYTESGLLKNFGTARQPSKNQVQTMLHHTHQASALSALVRLFLLALDIPAKTANDLLGSDFLQLCEKFDFVQRDEERVRPLVVITPLDDFLFVSDSYHSLASDEAAEFVLPASTHSASFLRQLMIREPVEDALDLCCGCGVHAIYASTFSKRVVATDISERALGYAKINASLNSRDNIEFVAGDLFSGVADKAFDLIVSNPPFVVGPAQEFVYRDNPMVLDTFCRHLIKDAPQFMKPGAHLQMLCEWVEVEDQPWYERLAEWFADTGCDAWILRSSPLPPAGYATARLNDITGPGIDPQMEYAAWISNFAAHRVTAIHPGHIVLRKREGENWIHARNLPRDIFESAGGAVLSAIAACDAVQDLGSDDVLMNSTLKLSEQLDLQQSFQRKENHWAMDKITLSFTGVLPLDGEVDMPVMAFLNLFDGSATVAECLEKFSASTKANPDQIRSQFLPIIRLFVGKQFIEVIS